MKVKLTKLELWSAVIVVSVGAFGYRNFRKHRSQLAEELLNKFQSGLVEKSVEFVGFGDFEFRGFTLPEVIEVLKSAGVICVDRRG